METQPMQSAEPTQTALVAEAIETSTPKQVNKINRDIYGSFSLSGIEFAISASAIQEVVNEQQTYHIMPLSPDYMLGLFNLRGMIIPVIDLRKIFHLGSSDDDATKERVIAIVEYEQFCVGLIFDNTEDVFDGNHKEKVQFSQSNDEPRELVVQGAFKLDDGNRIIQIIDPYEVINLKHLPQSKGSALSNVKKKMGKRKQCISFEVGGTVCAFNIEPIREVLTIDKIENRTLEGGNCLGAVNIRGNTVPIIDFAAFLGSEPVSIDNNVYSNHIVIVMKLKDGFFGLLVSSVKSIIPYYDEDIISFPVIGDQKTKMFEGCIPENKSIETILLNHNEIFTDSEISEISRGHASLYKEENTDTTSKAKKEVKKKTYILFTIESSYVLEMDKVNEVMDYPEDILTTPGLPKHIRGMFCVRGDLVPVIDYRVLYDLDSASSSKTPKVLIFISDDVKYGLVVDSIDSIVSLCSTNTLKIQKGSNSDRQLSMCAEDVIQMETDDGSQRSLLVMNIPLLTSKLNADVGGQATLH